MAKEGAKQNQAGKSLNTEKRVSFHQKHCLNCGTPLIGKYCYKCGQAASVQRYRPHTFIDETYKVFRKVDLTETLQTIWRLFVRPGEFVRDYLAGKRVGFINPIKLFIYGLVVEVTLRSSLVVLFDDERLATIASTSIAFQFVDLLVIVFWGLTWKLFYQHENLNAIECVFSAIFLQAQINFISILVLLLTLPVRELFTPSADYLSAVETLAQIIYTYYFAMQLFHQPKWKIFIKQTVLIVILILIAIPILIFGKYLN